MSDGVTDSEEDKLEEVHNLRRKQASSLKRVNTLEKKLQEYENKDHDESINDAKIT